MAASTITRVTWTDGAAGTVINNARKNSDIYDKIDEMFAGAGAYATFTFGGTVAIEGSGTALTVSAGVTGTNEIAVRNTSAGATNFAAIKIGNNGAADAGYLAHTSSTFTPTGSQPQDALCLRNSRVGGISIAAEHASGILAFYAGGTTERARLTAAGMLLLGDTTNANMTVGITINQGAADNEALALKSSDVAHGMTTLAETDTWGVAQKYSATEGGALFVGYSEGTVGLGLAGRPVTGVTTKSTAAVGAMAFIGQKKSGTTVGALGADENIAVFINDSLTRHILDGDGDSHQDVGTAWTNFDFMDDYKAMDAVARTLHRGNPDRLRTAFVHSLAASRRLLARIPGKPIITFNRNGHHFANMSRVTMLHHGAIRQLARDVQAIGSRLRALEA